MQPSDEVSNVVSDSGFKFLPLYELEAAIALPLLVRLDGNPLDSELAAISQSRLKDSLLRQRYTAGI